MKYLIVLSGMIILAFSSNVYSLDCSVSYKAKEIKIEKRWFGSVNRVKIHSGNVKGKGNNEKSCEKNALNKVKNIKNNKWKLLSKKTVVK